MVTNPFYDKTKVFLDQLIEFENKGDFENAIRISNEAISYIEGFRTRENNPMMQLYFGNYQSIWSLRKKILETNKKIDPYKNEISVKLNELIDRIQKLEKRLDSWEANR